MKYICKICGYVYDEDKEKTPFSNLPSDWKCPLCNAPKSSFYPEKTTEPEQEKTEKRTTEKEVVEHENLTELSYGALSSVCSNLARGCEKQYMDKESKMYQKLADYFLSIATEEKNARYENLANLVDENLKKDYPQITDISTEKADRGALRVKVWSEKVTNMLSALMERYNTEGEKMLEHTNVWVCSICGFTYVGDNPPQLCPVCKVQPDKFIKIEGGEA